MFSVIAVLILCCGMNLAEGPSELLKKGNEFYQKADYQLAVESYESALSLGFESPELYFNLGNAYYRLEKLGYAILNYEKANKLKPDDEDILYNLKIANLKTIDKIENVPQFFLIEWGESFLNYFSISGWTTTAYIFYILSLISAGIYFFTRSSIYQKKAFLIGSTVAFLFLLSSLFLFVKVNREIHEKYGIVVVSSVNAKTSPDEQSPDAFIAHEGIKIKLEDKVNNWTKGRLADGKIGWFPIESVKII